MPILEDLIKKPDAQLVNKESLFDARIEPMLVDGAEARVPQDVSPGADVTVDISPP